MTRNLNPVQFPMADLLSAHANDFDSTRVRDLGQDVFRSNGEQDGYYEALKDDVAKHGVRHPVHVLQHAQEVDGTRYSLVQGQHRAAVARDLGLPTIPAYVHPGVPQDDYEDFPTLTSRMRNEEIDRDRREGWYDRRWGK